MAARTRKTAAPVETVEEVVEETVAEPTFKQIANEAINDAAEQLGVNTPALRYKAQRAFGFIAIQLAIEAGNLDELIAEVVARAGDLPAGFGLEASVAAEKAPKAPAKAPAKKAPAAKAAPAKATARKRPTR